jgi:hypothetical protein
LFFFHRCVHGDYVLATMLKSAVAAGISGAGDLFVMADGTDCRIWERHHPLDKHKHSFEAVCVNLKYHMDFEAKLIVV